MTPICEDKIDYHTIFAGVQDHILARLGGIFADIIINNPTIDFLKLLSYCAGTCIKNVIVSVTSVVQKAAIDIQSCRDNSTDMGLCAMDARNEASRVLRSLKLPTQACFMYIGIPVSLPQVEVVGNSVEIAVHQGINVIAA